MFFTLCSAVSKLCFWEMSDRKGLWRLSVLCNSVSSWKQKSWGSSPGLVSGLVVIFLESALCIIISSSSWESNYLLSSARLRCSFNRCRALPSLAVCLKQNELFQRCGFASQVSRGKRGMSHPISTDGVGGLLSLGWGSNWASLISTIRWGMHLLAFQGVNSYWWNAG